MRIVRQTPVNPIFIMSQVTNMPTRTIIQNLQRPLPARRYIKIHELYAVSEVAELLHISNAIIYKMIHEGQLEAIRIGRLFRIAREDPDNFLRNG